MNDNSLKIYNSTDSLSLPIVDYANTYFLPFICLFGMFTSILNVIVLSKTKLDNDLNKYFFIISFCDLAFLATQVFIFIFRCGKLCLYSYTYGAKIYEKYIYHYLGFVIVTFSNLLDISISLERLSSFKINTTNKKFKISIKMKCVIYLITSVLICLPHFIIYSNPEVLGLLAIYDKTVHTTTYKTLFEVKFNLNFKII